MITKIVGLIITIVFMLVIYYPFHRFINSGSRPGYRFDTIAGWMMFLSLLICLGFFVTGTFSQLSPVTQYVVTGTLSGVSMCIMEKPHKFRRFLPIPYKLAWLTITNTLILFAGDVFNIHLVKYLVIVVVILVELNWIRNQIVLFQIFKAASASTKYYLNTFYGQNFSTEERALIEKDEKANESKRKVKKLTTIIAESIFTILFDGLIVYVTLTVF